MVGKRLEDGYEAPWSAEPGTYWKTSHGTWSACTPNGMLANLAAHKVFELADGTITVSPSILVTAPHSTPSRWHGYLENGIWREVA
jgi:hypothetical protein